MQADVQDVLSEGFLDEEERWGSHWSRTETVYI